MNKRRRNPEGGGEGVRLKIVRSVTPVTLLRRLRNAKRIDGKRSRVLCPDAKRGTNERTNERTNEKVREREKKKRNRTKSHRS